MKGSIGNCHNPHVFRSQSLEYLATGTMCNLNQCAIIVLVLFVSSVECSKFKRLEGLVQLVASRLDSESIARQQNAEQILERLTYMEMQLNGSTDSAHPSTRGEKESGTSQTCSCPATPRYAVPEDYILRVLKAVNEEKTINQWMRKQLPEVSSKVDVLLNNVTNTVTTIKSTMCTTESSNTDKVLLSLMTEIASSLNVLVEKFNNLSSTVELIETSPGKTSVTSPDMYYSKYFVTSKAPDTKKRNSCLSHFEDGYSDSGVYTVYPASEDNPVRVYCDMTTDGGGWTVFQRRQDGSVEFLRPWVDYKQGFGNLTGEFWLGNDIIASLTSTCCHELRVDLGDANGNKRFAKYEKFQVLPESKNFKLTVNGYSGDAMDRLQYHNGMMFSTTDRDNDLLRRKNCASDISFGAWWYNGCDHSNLNRRWQINKGVPWGTDNYAFSEMKLR